MDKLDKEIGKILKSEVAVPMSFENTIKNALNIENMKPRKNVYFYNFIKIAATFIITCVCGLGVAFAGVSTYNYFAKSSYQQVNVRPGDNPEIDAEYGIIQSIESDYIYYKKIIAFEDYKKCKEIWPDLYDMREIDFEDYFIVMVSVSRATKLPYYISNINSDDTTLYIEISQSEDETKYDNHKTFFSAKVEKQHDRENIKIQEILIGPNVDIDNYTDLNKIVEGESYSKEKAIKEGCLVVNEGNEIISSDRNQINDFIERTENGEEGHIRVVQYGVIKTIRDVEYRNGKYYVALYKQDSRFEPVETTLTYNRFDKLTKHYFTFDKVNWLYEICATDEGSGIEEPIVSYK